MKKSDCTEEQWAAYKAYAKSWRAANIERERERQRVRYQTRSDEVKAREKARFADPEFIKRKNEYNRKRYAAKKAAAGDGRAVSVQEHEARLERQRKSRTGMTKEIAAQVLDFQQGCCAICRRSLKEGKQARADHCHDSGKPRGILCHHCNIIEGMIRSMGISPVEFGDRLEHYLKNPPFQRFTPAA